MFDERQQQIDEIRRRNEESIGAALCGHIPSYELLATAEILGDDELLVECLIGRSVGLACTSRPLDAQRCLGQIRRLLEADITIGPVWLWRLHETGGIVAADFGEIQDAWVHHQNALEVARRFGLGRAVGISESTLGLVALKVGMLTDALSYLTSALEKPGMPPQVVLAIHLRLARVLSLQQNRRLADEQMAIAKRIGPSIEYTKMMADTAVMALDLGALDLAEVYAKGLRDHAEASGGTLAKLQSVLFQARMDQDAGEVDRSEHAARWVIANADEGLAVKVNALVILGELLVTRGDWTSALDILERPLLDRAPAELRKQVLTAQRKANEGLKHWEQVAWCHDELERHAQHISSDLLVVYELRYKAHQADALEEYNQVLQNKNDELEMLSLEKDSIMEMIANDLQSPLTSLQLTIDLLEADPSTLNIQSRVGTALRSINRIETIAHHLSVAGETDSGSVVPERRVFVLADSVADVVDRSSAVLDERSIQLTVVVEDVRLCVIADQERFEQMLAALLWGVAEFSRSRSVLKLKVGVAEKGEVSVFLDAPELGLSKQALISMQTRRISSIRAKQGGAGTDLAFYAADQLGQAIGIPINLEATSGGGNSFTLRLPVE